MPSTLIDPELYIDCGALCPVGALHLNLSDDKTAHFFGVVRLIDRRCTGCRLCEQVCGWRARSLPPDGTTGKSLPGA